MSARNYASQVQAGSVVRWDRLERAAFAGHPSVLAEGGGGRMHRGNNWNLIWGIPLVVVYLVCYLAPVWGYATISSGGRFATAAPDPDPESAIPVSGVIFIVASVLLTISLVHWLATGRARNGFYQVQAWLALIFGILTAMSIKIRGSAAGVDKWESWLIPAIVSASLGAVFLILHLIAGLARQSRRPSGGWDPADLPKKKLAIVHQRRERVAALSDDDRSSIRRDLDACIENLEDRGLVSAADAARARSAELGLLGLLMLPTRKPRR